MSKHILVVEDDHTLNEAFNTILTKEGYRVSRVNNGKEALEMLESAQAESVDLILLDLLMPTMGGIEFMQKFDVPKHSIPVIVFSNLDSEKDIDKVYELGATKYMLKAWASPKELAKIVRDTIGK